MGNLTQDPSPCAKCGTELTHGYVTIYNAQMKPERLICLRCNVRELYEAYEKTANLSTSLLVEAAIVEEWHRAVREATDREFGARVERRLIERFLTEEEAIKLRAPRETLQQLALRIDAEIWTGKLDAWVKASRFHGARFDMTDGDALLIFAMCGRCRLSLQKPNGAHLTVQCLEGEPNTMGWIGIAATLEEAQQLVDKLCTTFDVAKVTVDNKVSVF